MWLPIINSCYKDRVYQTIIQQQYWFQIMSTGHISVRLEFEVVKKYVDTNATRDTN